jgi:hypothetical protein
VQVEELSEKAPIGAVSCQFDGSEASPTPVGAALPGEQ